MSFLRSTAKEASALKRVEAGQKLLVPEAMKMETAVAAPAAGIVVQLNCAAGALVSPGQHLLMPRYEAGV